jgi:hypothetical protein
MGGWQIKNVHYTMQLRFIYLGIIDPGASVGIIVYCACESIGLQW